MFLFILSLSMLFFNCVTFVGSCFYLSNV